LILVASSIGGAGTGTAQSPQKQGEESPSVEITKMQVVVPEGYFILARKDAVTCAIRFRTAQRGRDRSDPTVLSSGQESQSAEYDWFVQGDGSQDFSRANVKSGHGQLRNGSSIGVGRLAFKPGAKLYVTCGSLRTRWGYPHSLAFLTYPKSDPRDDYQLELAPTKAREIGDVEARNPRLVWYRLDENRATQRIAVDKLP
jgi:hypothetical protein